MDRGIAAALVDEAHQQRKPAFAHPTTLQGLDIAIGSGVDVLAHTTPTEGPWPPELVKRLTDHRIALTPTLSLIEVELKHDNAPPELAQRFVRGTQQQLGSFARAGGQVLFGTDVGYIELVDTQREYTLMAGAGLDGRQILASLPTSPSERAFSASSEPGPEPGAPRTGVNDYVDLVWRAAVAGFAGARA